MSLLKNKNILMSGGSGYLGHHFARHLLEAGNQLYFLTHATPLTDLMAAYPAQVHCVSLGADADTVASVEFDFCFHVAGLYEPDEDDAAKQRMRAANLELGKCMAQRALAQTTPAGFVHIGSFWQVPGAAAHNYYTETKNLMSDYLHTLSREAGLKAVTLRLFDLYGPHDKRKKLLPYLHSLGDVSTPVKLTLGEQMIGPIFLHDAIAGLCAAAAYLAQTPPEYEHCFFDLGGALVSLKDFVLLWRDIAKHKIDFEWGGVSYRADQILHPVLGLPVPDWQPNVSLSDGLARSYAP